MKQQICQPKEASNLGDVLSKQLKACRLDFRANESMLVTPSRGSLIPI